MRIASTTRHGVSRLANLSRAPLRALVADAEGVAVMRSILEIRWSSEGQE
jgi:hypothetical protein